MARALPALLVIATALAAVAGAACDTTKPATRPVPTPGAQIVVKSSSAMRGTTLARGERIRFAVAGTGAGTHFGPATFLDSKAFSDLKVVAVVTSRLLWAQGTVSVAAPSGHVDVAAVSGAEISIDPWAFTIPAGDDIVPMGTPPAQSDSLPAAPSDAGRIDPAGDVDLFQVFPKDAGVHTLVFRVVRDAAAPADFEPSLEVYAADGTLLAAPAAPCAAVRTSSLAPLVARVADPHYRGGADRRYVLGVHVGAEIDCAMPASP